MDICSFEIPAPVALAIVCALGYLVGRQRRAANNDAALRSQRELSRAKAVASELEKIAWTLRKSLASHHASVGQFKQRVAKLSNSQRESGGKDLCREAEAILTSTLQLASQIANAYDEIRQQSAHLMNFTEVRTDPLTGVNNRRGLDDVLAAQLALMMRYESPFAVTMFDIDHFKLVNDREGHLHGDRVLKELARLFDASVRETDLVARYGGEEFVIVMPQTDLSGACALSERLREHVEKQLPVTVSGGVAAGREGDTIESLIARVDNALYSAKIAGRNCLYFYNGVATEPVVIDELLDNPTPICADAAADR